MDRSDGADIGAARRTELDFVRNRTLATLAAMRNRANLGPGVTPGVTFTTPSVAIPCVSILSGIKGSGLFQLNILLSVTVAAAATVTFGVNVDNNSSTPIVAISASHGTPTGINSQYAGSSTPIALSGNTTTVGQWSSGVAMPTAGLIETWSFSQMVSGALGVGFPNANLAFYPFITCAAQNVTINEAWISLFELPN